MSFENDLADISSNMANCIKILSLMFIVLIPTILYPLFPLLYVVLITNSSPCHLHEI